MKYINKTINNVSTKLLTYGNPFNNDGQDVIICITGNPGIIDFYIKFSQELHVKTNLPICVIGHAGHDFPNKELKKLQGHEHLFNLQGQLNHKLDLINNYIDKKSKLHFVGHSIGSWCIIEMLHNHDHLYKRTSTVNLLFPTIQKMAESKNGRWINSYVRKLHSILLLIILVFSLLPESVRKILINIYLNCKSMPANYNDVILKYLNPNYFEKVLFLAYDEMDIVTTLNSKGIEKIEHITNVVYSIDDGWAPLSYMDILKTYHPNLHMEEVSADHAFVIKSSESIAFLTSEFIRSKMYMSN